MKAGIGLLSAILIGIASAALAVIVCLVAGSAIMRYVVGSPFGFTEEVVGLLFFTMATLAIAHSAFAGREIRVDLLYNLLSPTLQLGGRLISGISVLAFTIWFGWLAWDFFALSLQIGARSDMAGITLWPWMSLFLLMALAVGLSVFWRSPEADQSHEAHEL